MRRGETHLPLSGERRRDVQLVALLRDFGAERNGLTHDDIAWIVPHQANLRIIDATAKRLGVDMEKVMINIQKYGNTSAGTIPICLWEWEDKLKKGDNLILAAFGAGFTWGAIYLKWGYNGKQA